ncbi:MAG: ABC transporter ATP-binding protein [Thermoplasmatota archaeon]
MKPVISVRGLRKTYGRVTALDNVDLDIYEGEIHGLFGANGAGKSTFIRVVTGITAPDSGSIEVLGMDVVSDHDTVRGLCTTIVEIPMIPPEMILYDILAFYCRVAGIVEDDIRERIAEAVSVTGIGDIMFKKFGKMSLGQQHRVEVARGIATAGDLLMMDEPFIGIDIGTKRELKNYFRSWVREKDGRGVVFTSHNLLENENFVDRLTFIKNGRIVETDRLSAFKTKYLKTRFSIEMDDIEKGVDLINEMNLGAIESQEGNSLIIQLQDEEMIKRINREMALRGVCVEQVVRLGNIEEIFSTLTEVES